MVVMVRVCVVCVTDCACGMMDAWEEREAAWRGRVEGAVVGSGRETTERWLFVFAVDVCGRLDRVVRA